jgi:glycosyltransferase involved in cell wall biosynthesis
MTEHRRLCVLTVIDSMIFAGAELLAARIATSLDRNRFRSIICSTRPSAAERVGAVRGEGVEVLELGRRSKLDLWRWRPLVRLLRSGEVDVVHAHKFGSNLWTVLLTRGAHVPVVLAHEHSWSFEGNPLRRLIDRELIARSATMFLTVSEHDRERVIELERIPQEKVRCVLNGVPDRPAGDRTRARQALGLSAEAPVVGTVCGLRPEKRVDLALEAISLLVGDHPQLRFVVVGDGPERPRLERLSEDLAVPTLFLGARPDHEIPDLVAAMDVLVSTSSFEGTPLSVLEWMAESKAIVATRVGGIPGLIEDGTQGILVPPGDAQAVAHAVGHLLADPAARERLGAAARARQQAEFRFERTVEVLEDLYETLYWSSPRGLRARATGVDQFGVR